MTEALQSGHHLDAEQIGAFIEHALPAHEREQIFGHLADCAECRAIVALSLPAAEEPTKAASVSVRRPWWSSWMIAWPAAAALASLAVFVVYIHRTAIFPSGQTANEVAKSNQPAPQSAIGQLTAPQRAASSPEFRDQRSANGRAPAGNENGHASEGKPSATDSVEQSMKALPMAGRSVESLNELSQMPPASAVEDRKKSARLATGSGIGMGGGIGMEYAPAAGANASGAVSNAPQAAAQMQPEMAAPSGEKRAKPAAMMPPASNSEMVAVENAAARIDTESANLDARIDEMPIALMKRPLPSRLPVLSIANRMRSIVAIDTSNEVFVSKDEGKHWKPVHAPWPGRAVKAELVALQTADLEKEKGAVAGALYSDKGTSLKKMNGTASAQTKPAGNPYGTSITGTVTDPTGAVIASATVSVVDKATHTGRSVTTDRNGQYAVGGLAPGTYQVTARALGFETLEIADLAVADGHPTVADLSLNVGTASQSVTVAAEPPEVTPVPKPRTSNQHPAIFEITTEAGEQWTSADGVTWTRAISQPQK
ncbi:MAG: carboxypeptidase regulatory-like domain-containing protein [Terracidiphilus sp.]|jgi:hypothetical protein